MVTHVVLLRLRKNLPEKEADRLFAELAALKGKIPGLSSFAGGLYASPEGLNRGFTHGFVMTFRDERSRDGYLSHPEHEKVKEMVLGALDGGVDGSGGVEGVIAFDFAS